MVEKTGKLTLGVYLAKGGLQSFSPRTNSNAEKGFPLPSLTRGSNVF
jgi:hypothetical protein